MARGKSIYQPKRLRYVYDPFEKIKIKDKETRREALEQIRDFIHDQILERVSNGSSPVSKEGWVKSLSPKYRDVKDDISNQLIANMELHGDMLDALQVKIFDRNKIAVEIRGTQAEKADGHCKLTGRENKTLKKKRRFIPGENQTFKRDILTGINAIAKDFKEDEDG